LHPFGLPSNAQARWTSSRSIRTCIRQRYVCKLQLKARQLHTPRLPRALAPLVHRPLHAAESTFWVIVW
ncbi:hypothetical protein BOTBODRAFT_67794, partial [Botryobasidium botryosum FD-172 SS1]